MARYPMEDENRKRREPLEEWKDADLEMAMETGQWEWEEEGRRLGIGNGYWKGADLEMEM